MSPGRAQARITVCYNLIFIYGPPATGKFTVGTELAQLTGYHLVHNHLTIDIVKDIYPHFDSLPFDLVFDLRLALFKHAAKHNTNLVTTFVYDNDEADKAFVENVVQAVQQNGGKVLFVHLTASNKALLERVTNESRRKLRKLTDREAMQALLQQPQFNASISFEGMKIDTTNQDARATAKQIANHFKLLG